MKYLIIFMSLLITSCSDFGEEWRDGKYVVYWIDIPSSKVLGFDLGEGGYIQRIPSVIKKVGSNRNFVAALSCSNDICSYYFIDRTKDHKFADSKEFVSGPYTEKEYNAQKLANILPHLNDL